MRRKNKKSVPYSPASLQVLSHMYPHIRISPFLPAEWSRLRALSRGQRKGISGQPTFWLDDAHDAQFYASGRTALLACLKHLGLTAKEEVLIIKTTDGPYISSCVTKTIEQVCLWSRQLSEQTRLVLVIHEFGFPCGFDKIKPFARKGLPILEDCAYALGSRMGKAPVGNFGDFAIYSLPKYYPVPFGGLLASKTKIRSEGLALRVAPGDQDLLSLTIDSAQKETQRWNQERREHWKFFARHLPAGKFKPYFDLGKNIVPGVFLTTVPADFKGEDIKRRLNQAGVESTQYYHQGGFYFPVHQFLTDYEKEYILFHFLAGQGTKTS
ncbi:MAG: DegT/DnrJ/EryC1/StrS family aminotransferase [Candidatus Omnitrophota bacterium]